MNTPQQNHAQRHALLGLLYAARQAQPDAGWVPLTDLRDAVGECAFALGVLVEVGQAKTGAAGPLPHSGQTFRYRITGDGVLAYEAAHGA